MFTAVCAVLPCTVAVNVTWPTALAVSTGELPVVIVASLVRLGRLQVASGRGRPWSSVAVNCCVWPTARLTFVGVIVIEAGAREREGNLFV